MSWPIGLGSSGVRYEQRAGVGLFANGIRITDADGWMYIPVPGIVVSVCVRFTADHDAAPLFYIDGVRAGGRHYRSVYALLVNGHDQLAIRLAERFHAELTRLSQASIRPRMTEIAETA